MAREKSRPFQELGWTKPGLLVLGVVAAVCIVGFGFRAEGATKAPQLLRAIVPSEFPGAKELTLKEAPRRAEPLLTAVAVLDGDSFTSALNDDLSQLGSLSIGPANRGYLFNGVPMPESPRWVVVEPAFSFGTRETVDSLVHAIDAVNELYPDSPQLHVGHLSRPGGGWLRPHRSHQSGRDVDLGFYYRDGSKWYVRATPQNFDVQRNWALLSAMLKTSPVEYIFIDQSLHEALRAEALAVGESPELIQQAFDGVHGVTEPLIRHARGHDDHMHVRFMSAAAVATAERTRAALGKGAFSVSGFLRMLQLKARKQQTH